MPRTASDDSVFHAIACPTRRALLDELVSGERNVSDLVAALDVTQSAVSQQLAVLKSAGLVEERAEGRFRYYRLRREPLAEIESWLDGYRAQVEHQLDALGRVLDAMPDEAPKAASKAKRSSRSSRRSRAHEARPSRSRKQTPRSNRRERTWPSAKRQTKERPERSEAHR